MLLCCIVVIYFLESICSVFRITAFSTEDGQIFKCKLLIVTVFPWILGPRLKLAVVFGNGALGHFYSNLLKAEGEGGGCAFGYG